MAIASETSLLAEIIERHKGKLIDAWTASQIAEGALRAGRGTESSIRAYAGRFTAAFSRGATSSAGADIAAPGWQDMRDLLEEVATERGLNGYSASETAVFVFSIKQPLFALLRNELGADREARLPEAIWSATQLLDRLGLFTAELYQRTRDQIIMRQQQELLELSTPVVALWDHILAVPLIGTLDSARTQVVMESLLEEIVRSGAQIAIIDITGVPTVDTLVAQHLLKTIAAARLMGAECIISGIRPQIAQTMVHLGLDLNVISKATLADAFALALQRTGKRVAARSP